MALKFFAVAALISIARGEVVGAKAAIPVPLLARASDATYDPLPQYYFGYDVQDALTGDSKSQIESRNGGVVVGQYSLNDPDGTRRIVDYTSDSLNGFNAVVRKVPVALAAPVVARVAAAPAVETVVAKAVAAPVAVKAAPPPAEVEAAPIAKAAPLAKAAPAPVAAKAAPVVKESVVAERTSEAGHATPVVAPAPAPAAYTAPIIAYAGFAAPLAITLW